MVEKQNIIAKLGEERLLLPEMIALGLRANDQVKYFFALLQTARLNCDAPSIPAPDLRGERIASGIADPSFDTFVASCSRKDGDSYLMPDAPMIFENIVQGIRSMLKPIAGDRRRELDSRLAQQLSGIGMTQDVPGALIDAITLGDKSRGDSLHLIVMDAHRALNQLQVDFAEEQIAGAHVYNLSPAGRELVASFMAGLNRTAPLKFDHPGLGTTATEYDGKLVIQNDIGTTDAHVLVIRVADMTVSFTYTDIHLQRLDFFQSLFRNTEATWEKTSRQSDDAFETSGYFLATATCRAEDMGRLQAHLEFLGSRLVFLIDWNKARKQLRRFIGKNNAVSLLQWAADNDVGHRGLLEIGGEQALNEAIEFAAGARLHYGDRLDKVLGSERTEEFLRFALRIAATGLRQKRSGRVIKDEIKTRLSSFFESAYISLLVLAQRHAEFIIELATSLRDAIYTTDLAENRNRFVKLAKRAAAWESKADVIFNTARAEARRIGKSSTLLRFFERADDAADHLEDAVAMLPLIAGVVTVARDMEPVRQMTDQMVESVQEFIRCLENGINVSRSDTQADMDDFLNAVDRMVDLEHQADDLFRSAREKVVVTADNFRELFLLMELANMIESATNSLNHGAQILRTSIMELSLG